MKFMMSLVAAMAMAASAVVARDDAKEPEPLNLKIQPAQEPYPPLRYQLLPEFQELRPGNPILGYLKCFSEQQYFFFDTGAIEQREKWLNQPLHELPVAVLLRYGGVPLKRADQAARLAHPDWEILHDMQRDHIGTIIPEVQQMRMLAVALKVRLRGQIAAKEYDNALVTIKTLMSMARHLGSHPSFIAGLVGIAIANMALDGIEEMVQQPDAPGLFWALQALPRPLFTLDAGALGERYMWNEAIAFLKHDHPMNDDELQRTIQKAQELISLFGGTAKNTEVKEWLDKHQANPETLEASRSRLVKAGMASDLIKQMRSEQVLFNDLYYYILSGLDRDLLLARLPNGNKAKWSVADGDPKPLDISLFKNVIPKFANTKLRHVKLEQRIAMLVHVEAIRMHVSQHNQLPLRLSDMNYPLPLDPVSSSEFKYVLQQPMASIVPGLPEGDHQSIPWNRPYQVQIAK